MMLKYTQTTRYMSLYDLTNRVKRNKDKEEKLSLILNL